MIEFVVIYGAYVWPALLVLGALVGAVLPGVLLVRRVRREAFDQVKTFRNAADPVFDEGESVALRGKLHVVGPPARRFEDSAATAASTVRMYVVDLPTSLAMSRQASHLELRVDGEVIRISSPVLVSSGSFETHPKRKFSALDAIIRESMRDSSTVEIPKARQPVFRSVGDGESLWARGVLVRNEKETGTVGYREDATEWSLVAPLATAENRDDEDDIAPEESMVQLVFDGTPEVRGPAWPRRVIGAVTATFLVFCFLTVVGWGLREGTERPSSVGALATATPFYRCIGLGRLGTERLAKVMNESLVTNIVECRNRISLDELAWRVFEQGRPKLASSLHQQAERREGGMLIYDHYYNAHIAVHLLADEPERAADVTVVEDRTSEIGTAWFERRRCVQAALRHRLGDASALDVLRRASAAKEGRGACTLLLADQLEGRERLDVLATCVDDCSRWNNRQLLVWLLRFEAAVCGHEEGLAVCEELLGEGMPLRHLESPQQLLMTESSFSYSRVPGLELVVWQRLAREGESDDSELGLLFVRSQLAEALGTFMAISQEPDEARSYLRQAIADREAVARRLERSSDAAEESPFSGPSGWNHRGRTPSEAARIELDRARAFACALEAQQGAFDEARAHFDRMSDDGRERYLHLSEWMEVADPSRPLPAVSDEIINEHVLEEYWSEVAVDGAREIDGERFARGYHWINAPTNLLVLIGRRIDPAGQAAVREAFVWNDAQQHVRFNMVRLASNVPALLAIGDEERAREVQQRLSGYRQALLRRDLAVFLAVLD